MCINTDSNSNLSNTTCPVATPSEEFALPLISFLLEGILQLMISSFGIFANTASIIILSRKALKNFFNQLLVVLAVYDLVYCVTVLLESLSKLGVPSNTYNLLFPYLLYPLNSISMTGSIYMTIAIAMERYIAVQRPIFRVPNQFRSVTNDYSHWKKQLIKYVAPISVFSLFFNFPKFFESQVVYKNKVLHFDVTNLRMSRWYVMWYHNWARFLMLGVVPFFTIAFFNFKIYCILNKQKSVPPHTRKKQEETHSGVLLMIVITFLVCNFLRILLNMHEIFVIDEIELCKCSDLGGFPVWILILGFISPVFLTFNSSINLVIYCVFGAKFRKELHSILTVRSSAGSSSFEMVTVL